LFKFYITAFSVITFFLSVFETDSPRWEEERQENKQRSRARKSRKLESVHKATHNGG